MTKVSIGGVKEEVRVLMVSFARLGVLIGYRV